MAVASCSQTPVTLSHQPPFRRHSWRAAFCFCCSCACVSELPISTIGAPTLTATTRHMKRFSHLTCISRSSYLGTFRIWLPRCTFSAACDARGSSDLPHFDFRKITTRTGTCGIYDGSEVPTRSPLRDAPDQLEGFDTRAICRVTEGNEAEVSKHREVLEEIDQLPLPFGPAVGPPPEGSRDGARHGRVSRASATSGVRGRSA